ncbi:aspartate/glutamate racemase family protein [Georgenia alba]|uniref:Aspartate/glutamate racemase family protein n=1 Tax=Georgenia alba TaxID=2233858 RepID=A0ABW2QAJ2_9MICO
MTEAPLVGILGGMGPAATAAFYVRLVEVTPASRDQDHPKVVMWADPSVPDRTAALLHGGESIVPWLERGLLRLSDAGATFVVSPCNTAHVWLPDVARDVGVELLSIVDTAVDAALEEVGSGGTVGVLGTHATIASAIYQDGLAARGLTPVVPDADHQAGLVRAIYAVKAGGDQLGEAGAIVREVCRSLVARGVGLVLNACTEISLVLDGVEQIVPVVDSSDALARATVDRVQGRA